jgi:phospholipase C
VPDLRSSTNLADDFGQMGFRIPAVLVSPYARRGYVDHSIYGFESILKMIRYRYGLAPLTPRDLFANNIAAAFDWESPPNYEPAELPTPPNVIRAACPGTSPVDSGGTGLDDGGLLGTPLLAADTATEREPHSLYDMVSTGYLERLGFKYRPATASTMFRHPSKLGLRA